MSKPILWIVIPCYNEEQVLPITAPMFLEKIHSLAAQGLVSEKSRVLFVNDGSKGFRPLLFRVDFYKMKVICNYV